jgi:hypothetical protein
LKKPSTQRDKREKEMTFELRNTIESRLKSIFSEGSRYDKIMEKERGIELVLEAIRPLYHSDCFWLAKINQIDGRANFVLN